MEKRRISRILARADGAAVKRLADEIKAVQSPVIVKAPEKSLAMIRMREPVQESLFYLGEVIVCEAIVDLAGKKGVAVLMGDDFDKVLDMAVIDAASSSARARRTWPPASRPPSAARSPIPTWARRSSSACRRRRASACG